MNIYELTGAELDYWVAKCVSPKGVHWIEDGKTYMGGYWSGHSTPIRMCGVWWSPSTDWSQGGPLIEERGINTVVHCIENNKVTSWRTLKHWPVTNLPEMTGETPLIAAMRALVASKYGDEVGEGERQ